MGTEFVVITPQPSLGEKIRRSLSGSGGYNVHIAGDFSEAIKLVPQTGSVLVFLDTEIGDNNLSILEIGYALRQLNDHIDFVIIAAQGETVEVGKLNARGTLYKPLDQVELIDLVNTIVSSQGKLAPEKPKQASAPVSASSPSQEFPWLQDINRAAQHLTRLTLESSAQAALITRDNQLWAYAGQLSQDAAQELTRTVQRYWDRESNSDLLRFVRLEATEQSHMLYATQLSPDLILALVFDGETPFSTIRSQAGRLASSLSSSPSSTQTVQLESPPAQEDDIGAFAFEDEAENGEGQFFPSITDLLNDVPPPNPPELSKSQIGVTRSPSQSGPPPLNPARPVSAPPVFTNEPVNLPNLFNQLDSDNGDRPPIDIVFDADNPESQIETRPHGAELPPDLAATRKHVPLPDSESLVETRPSTLFNNEGVQRIVVEPASPALYNLNYACLLVPRFEHHYLTGGLADVLGDWVPHICIAFGWRLEHLAIRPEYLQWVVNVPPSTSPAYLMRIVRQQTSERIFNDVPRFRKENPSGDFWAPGYLIMGGSQPHPPKLVKDFIKQTRQRQGVSPRTPPR
jgi:REP element-mobilizing transposase RayT/DNA-binding NarL/FixJ family response regulator